MYACSTGMRFRDPGYPPRTSRRTTLDLDLRPGPQYHNHHRDSPRPGGAVPGSVSRAWSGDARGRPIAHYSSYAGIGLAEKSGRRGWGPGTSNAEGAKPASSHPVHATYHPEPQCNPADRLRRPRRPARGLAPSEIGTAAEPGAPTAVPHVNRLKAWLAPPFFSPPAIVWLFRLSRGRKEASAVIPRPDGRPTWFDHARAASRIGSRTDPSHCTPRRYVGVDGTRDWPHPSG